MRGSTALTIGNFDGVHRGHQQLLKRAREHAAEGGRVVALAFHPHPLTQLRPRVAPPPVSTYQQRLRSLRMAGADEVHRLEPTTELLNLGPQEFLDRLLVDWRPDWIVEGDDFRFGSGRSGSIDLLRRIGRELGFKVATVEPVEATLTDHTVVRCSSTIVRWLIARGRMRDASRVLGRPYEIESIIEPGHRRGRDIGFPTMNLAPNGCLLPTDGVYAGWGELPCGGIYPAAISVGSNPTFEDSRRICEAYLIGYNGPLDHYGWPLRLHVDSWIRGQIRYDSVDPLFEQLKRDTKRALELIEPCTPPQPIPQEPSPA